MNDENLKPLNTRTPEERTAIAKLGQAASVKKRKENKIISQLYAEVIADIYNETPKDGELNAKDIIKSVLLRGDHSTVAMMKEMRESLEGQKINFNDVSEGRMLLVDYMTAEDLTNTAENIGTDESAK